MNKDYIQDLWSKIFRQSDIMNKVKDWLQEVVNDNQDIVDAKENNEAEITTDGTNDILIGWHECSQSLLEKISEWEKEDAENDTDKRIREE